MKDGWLVWWMELVEGVDGGMGERTVRRPRLIVPTNLQTAIVDDGMVRAVRCVAWWMV